MPDAMQSVHYSTGAPGRIVGPPVGRSRASLAGACRAEAEAWLVRPGEERLSTACQAQYALERWMAASQPRGSGTHGTATPPPEGPLNVPSYPHHPSGGE